MAYGYAKLLGARALALTMTNGLLDQYGEFGDMLPVKGMGNYPCRALGNLLKCDAGPCLDGESCPYRENGCDYYDAVRAGAGSSLVRSNYDFWLSHPEEALGRFDLLICDEAHELPAKLASAAGASFSANEISLPHYSELGQWATWAWRKRDEIRAQLERDDIAVVNRRDLRSLLRRLHAVAGASPATWAWEEGQERGQRVVRFEPISPAPYAEGLLWRGVSKVLLMSATIRPADVADLGVAQEDVNFFESASPIPVERRPVYWIPFGHRITAKSDPEALMAWVKAQDAYMSGRVDRAKGIIHTMSYKRAKFLKEHSRFGAHMMVHTSESTKAKVEEFKARQAPAILVSPVMHTGWDFPDDTARWQIVAKVPLLDTRAGIAAARQAHDPMYSVRHAIRTIQQMTGRVNRGGPQDYGETAIIDDTMQWVWSRYRPLFASWWRKAFKISSDIPTFPAEIP